MSCFLVKPLSRGRTKRLWSRYRCISIFYVAVQLVITFNLGSHSFCIRFVSVSKNCWFRGVATWHASLASWAVDVYLTLSLVSLRQGAYLTGPSTLIHKLLLSSSTSHENTHAICIVVVAQWYYSDIFELAVNLLWRPCPRVVPILQVFGKTGFCSLNNPPKDASFRHDYSFPCSSMFLWIYFA